MIPLDPALRRELDDAVDDAVRSLAARLDRHPGLLPLIADTLRTTPAGKRLRPALLLTSHQAFSPSGAPSHPARIPAAVAFELLHEAFLAHDDVIDDDVRRRGAPTVGGRTREHARRLGADDLAARELGDAAGILTGDLLLTEAHRLIALAPAEEHIRRGLLDLFAEAVLVSAAGELADVSHATLPAPVPPDELIGAAHDKTAVYSFSAPLRAGALLAGADRATDAALAEIGSALGLAFQLADDLIGAFGTADQAGRDTGADLRSAKQTPLVALARDSADWPRIRIALQDAPTGPVAILRAQDALENGGARDALEALIRRTTDRARAGVARRTLPPAAAALLLSLADAVEARIP